MFSITLKRPVTTLAVMAGLLAVTAPAGASPTRPHAGVVTDNKDPDRLVFSGDAYDNEMGITAAVLIG